MGEPAYSADGLRQVAKLWGVLKRHVILDSRTPASATGASMRSVISVAIAISFGAVATANSAPSPFTGHWTKDLASVKGFATDADSVDFEFDGQTFKVRAYGGQHYQAKIGGPAVAVLGEKNHDAAVRRSGPLTLIFDEHADGEPYSCILTADPIHQRIHAMVKTRTRVSTFDWVRSGRQ